MNRAAQQTRGGDRIRRNGARPAPRRRVEPPATLPRRASAPAKRAPRVYRVIAGPGTAPESECAEVRRRVLEWLRDCLTK